MAVYNGERFLTGQVNSVLNDLMPGDELVVIDDGSVDSSLSLLKAMGSPDIRIYRNSANLGVIASFERGLKLAVNDIVFLCDQDDIWLAGKRATVVKSFEEDSSVSLVLSDAEVIDEAGNVTNSSFMRSRGGFASGVFSTIWRNRYLGCAMAMRRSVLVKAIPVPSYVPMHDMWFGLVGKLIGKVVYIPSPLIQYRRHGCNVSPSHRQPVWRMLNWRLRLIVAILTRFLSWKCCLHRSPIKKIS
jgi:glycosyltransferase involved in cell wall biosynthesis